MKSRLVGHVSEESACVSFGVPGLGFCLKTSDTFHNFFLPLPGPRIYWSIGYVENTLVGCVCIIISTVALIALYVWIVATC